MLLEGISWGNSLEASQIRPNKSHRRGHVNSADGFVMSQMKRRLFLILKHFVLYNGGILTTRTALAFVISQVCHGEKANVIGRAGSKEDGAVLKY